MFGGRTGTEHEGLSEGQSRVWFTAVPSQGPTANRLLGISVGRFCSERVKAYIHVTIIIYDTYIMSRRRKANYHDRRGPQRPFSRSPALRDNCAYCTTRCRLPGILLMLLSLQHATPHKKILCWARLIFRLVFLREAGGDVLNYCNIGVKK